MDDVTLCWILVTVFCCGAWMGWFAGRRHEKSVQALKRMRVAGSRRYTINVDYGFARDAFRFNGYEIVSVSKQQGPLH